MATVTHKLYSGEMPVDPGDEGAFYVEDDSQNRITMPNGDTYGFDIPPIWGGGARESSALYVVVDLVDGVDGYLGTIKMADAWASEINPETEWLGPYLLYQPAPESPSLWLTPDTLPLVKTWTTDQGNGEHNLLQIGLDSSPIAVFTNDSIQQISGIFSTDCIGDRLPWDEVSAVVQYGRPDAPNYDPYGPNLRELPYGTPVKWVHGQDRVVRLYLTGFERIGKYLFRPTAVSGVGLLANVMHPGGLYNLQTFSEVAAEIIGGLFHYEVSEELASEPVIGWIPYKNARDNLHALLFVLGAAIRKSKDGLIRFGFLSEGDPTEVEDGRIVFGGSVEYMAPATAAEITEHTYFKGDFDETVSLFDNTAAGSDVADHALILFDQDGPVYDLSTTGSLTINSSGVNHAVVTGVGVLSGKLYSHATRVVSKSDTQAAGLPNIKRVTDNGLVSILNSQNVAKRVLAYYSSAKTVQSRLLLQGERTGDCIVFSDPYNERTKGYLQEMSVQAGAGLFGDCEIVADYTPTGQGNNISTVVLLTEAGTLTVPADVTQLTLVLIGGGNGGRNGQDGIEGWGGFGPYWLEHTSTETYNVAPGKGGQGGPGGYRGLGGRIFRITFSVTPWQVFPFNPGVGGEAGQDGTASTFGPYSSDDGDYIEYGYVDPVNGGVYGKAGVDGAWGANGGAGGSATGSGSAGTKGEDTLQYGGAPSASVVLEGSSGQIYIPGGRDDCVLGGLGGGGASATGGGRPAAPTRYTMWTDTENKIVYKVADAWGGNGADGASKAAKTGYGYGGDGGDGGGGGGGAGGYRNDPWYYADPYVEKLRIRNVPGSGGKGGTGGKGGPGCALVYYGTN